MRTLFALLLLGIGTFSVAEDAVADVDFVPYQAFVKETLDDMMFLFDEQERSTTEKIDRLEKVWNDRFVGSYVTRFILGPYARKVDSAVFARFEKVFAQVTSLSLSERVGDLKKPEYSFRGARDMKSSVFVTTRFVTGPTGKEIDIDWRLIYRNNRYGIVDIVISNISLLQSFRSEYTAYLRGNKGDLDALVKELERKLSLVKQS